MPEDNTGVPVIDLSSFADGGSESDRAEAAKGLRDAAENVGFFYIKGHGFPKQVHSDMFKLTKEFFELPEDKKMDLEARKNPLYRGYNNVETGAHTCTPDDAAEHPPDLKESFTIGAEPTKTMTSPMHGPNQWPSEKDCAAFEPTVRKYWESLTGTVAPRLMHALALSLDLPVDFFQSKATHPHSQMVLLKYPPNNGKVRRGCGAHTDCGFLTILTQDEDGLEVKRKDGTWVAAPVIPDTFVVNIGDMLAHWTNDRYKSTEHRVSNFSETKTRYSIPFFFAVDYNTRVATIDSCRDFRNGVVYEPCISGEYILGKLGLMHLAEVGSESPEESIKRERDENGANVQEPGSGADDDQHPAKRPKATTE
eukprot:Nitzschia sp. Nitz4//scaffold268_size26297//20682//21779//NITZ4_008282-RA/size26297-processed-gene-0.13-mRNA-1//-1//CDS//3329544945//5113//frame0